MMDRLRVVLPAAQQVRGKRYAYKRLFLLRETQPHLDEGAIEFPGKRFQRRSSSGNQRKTAPHLDCLDPGAFPGTSGQRAPSYTALKCPCMRECLNLYVKMRCGTVGPAGRLQMYSRSC